MCCLLSGRLDGLQRGVLLGVGAGVVVAGDGINPDGTPGDLAQAGRRRRGRRGRQGRVAALEVAEAEGVVQRLERALARLQVLPIYIYIYIYTYIHMYIHIYIYI